MIRLAKPNIPEEAIKRAIEVIRSGNLVQGKYVKEFEESLCNYLNVKNAIVVSSGTAALHLSLIALDIKVNDEVIVPAFTFPATANVVEAVGAKPVFVDINLTDFCIDTSKIEDKITQRTTAIIPVQEFGQASKMDDILEISKKYKLKIIEDAACALGTEFDMKKAGTFGDCGCFSFHPRKAITTGEGGVIVTNNNILADKIRALRNHGINITDNKIEFKYAGLNYRMTDFQAVLGLEQLINIEEDIARRIEIAKEYNRKLEKIDWIKIPELFENRRMVYQTYHILIDEKIDRNGLIKYLRENDIEVNYGAQVLNCIQFYKKKYNLTKDSAPNAANAFYQGIALPIGTHILSEDIEYISNILKALRH